MIAILLGLVRVLFLRGLAAGWAVWFSPALRIFAAIVISAGLTLAVWHFWPSGSAIERAAVEALGERETITKQNADEESRDNAWLEKQEQWMASERAAAEKAAGGAADRLVWRADDPWLRGKRAANR